MPTKVSIVFWLYSFWNQHNLEKRVSDLLKNQNVITMINNEIQLGRDAYTLPIFNQEYVAMDDGQS